MTKRSYNAATLKSVLRDLEASFGLSSDEFYELHLADAVPDRVPRFTRHVWASFHRDVRRLEHADFAEGARRALALG